MFLVIKITPKVERKKYGWFYLQTKHYNRTQLICLLSNSMAGVNSPWFDLIQKDIINFKDFEQVFKEKFWNEEIRRNISREIEFGHYVTGKSSRYNYAIRKIKLAYDLDENLDKKDFINRLARHFDREIRLLV